MHIINANFWKFRNDLNNVLSKSPYYLVFLSVVLFAGLCLGVWDCSMVVEALSKFPKSPMFNFTTGKTLTKFIEFELKSIVRASGFGRVVPIICQQKSVVLKLLIWSKSVNSENIKKTKKITKLSRQKSN